MFFKNSSLVALLQDTIYSSVNNLSFSGLFQIERQRSIILSELDLYIEIRCSNCHCQCHSQCLFQQCRYSRKSTELPQPPLMAALPISNGCSVPTTLNKQSQQPLQAANFILLKVMNKIPQPYKLKSSLYIFQDIFRIYNYI